jgi:DNA-binding NarL/FixJ family response regulator
MRVPILAYCPLSTEQEQTMSLRYIHIIDNDPAAATVTQLGLQARLKAEAQVTLASMHAQDQHNGIPHGLIDLLIVDPGGQNQAAIRLIKKLLEACPNTPVLVLTAYDSPLLRTQMQALGVKHYLAKPVDLLDLEQVVRNALQHTPANHYSDGWHTSQPSDQTVS